MQLFQYIFQRARDEVKQARVGKCTQVGPLKGPLTWWKASEEAHFTTTIATKYMA